MPFPIVAQSPVTFGPFNLGFEIQGDNVVAVLVTDAKTGVVRGTPIRFKLTGDSLTGNLAADMPGVDPTYFVTGNSVTGPNIIVNG